MLQRLARASEYRDDDTGEHTQRVGRTSALIARQLDLDAEDVELIGHAATLHDVGKIAIPDHVLLKPGSLTDEEFELMKTHVRAGAEMLAHSRSPLLQVAERIALTHHEWWDGSGYLARPARRRDSAARAHRGDRRRLRRAHARPSRTSARLPLEMALAEIRSLRGRQFDPRVVDAFDALPHAGDCSTWATARVAA